MVEQNPKVKAFHLYRCAQISIYQFGWMFMHWQSLSEKTLFLRQYFALTLCRGSISKWPGIGWWSNILCFCWLRSLPYRQISDQWPLVRPYDFWSHFQLQEPGSWWSCLVLLVSINLWIHCVLLLFLLQYRNGLLFFLLLFLWLFVFFLFLLFWFLLLLFFVLFLLFLLPLLFRWQNPIAWYCLVIFYRIFLYLFMFLWVL